MSEALQSSEASHPLIQSYEDFLANWKHENYEALRNRSGIATQGHYEHNMLRALDNETSWLMLGDTSVSYGSGRLETEAFLTAATGSETALDTARALYRENPDHSTVTIEGKGSNVVFDFWGGSDEQFNLSMPHFEQPRESIKEIARALHAQEPYVGLRQWEADRYELLSGGPDPEQPVVEVPYPRDLSMEDERMIRFVLSQSGIDSRLFDPAVPLSDSIKQWQTAPAQSKGGEQVIRSQDGALDAVEFPQSSGRQSIVISGEGLRGGTEISVVMRIDTRILERKGAEHPFIETDTARSFYTAIASAGYELSDRLKVSLGERDGQLYGNGYADLTRNIMYAVRKAGTAQGADMLVNNVGDLGVAAQNLRTQLESIDDEPAYAALATMADILDPSPETEFTYYDSGLSLKDGGCKDVEHYFLDAQDEHETVDDGLFIRKFRPFGAETAINQRPYYVNGVRIPAGAVSRLSSDGSVQPMRLTMFAFDPDQAVTVFGQQAAGLMRNRKMESENIRIGSRVNN